MEEIFLDKSLIMECIIQNPQYVSETSMDNDQKEGYFSDSSMRDYSVCDLSDEEISTKKEKHLRLGPEDLNDTIPYD
ncbi:smx5 isoform X3 [Silurus meridionalis]|uniref:smx5 isoform X3 n=1 Tax=Silurus meridionalis TaxID=175797 RepID=UPI001EEACB81|nr:smx5 isoform X3 [Silurus meridionalis]